LNTPRLNASNSSSDESSDTEDFQQADYIVHIQRKRLDVEQEQRMLSEIYSSIFNAQLKQKFASFYNNLPHIKGLDCVYTKSEHTTNFNDPAPSPFRGNSVIFHNKNDRSITKTITELTSYTIEFSDNSSITFESLSSPLVLNQVRNDFNEKLDQLANSSAMPSLRA
jgi:hypothetical protein